MFLPPSNPSSKRVPSSSPLPAQDGQLSRHLGTPDVLTDLGSPEDESHIAGKAVPGVAHPCKVQDKHFSKGHNSATRASTVCRLDLICIVE